jgi:signal transduction histidine kinase
MNAIEAMSEADADSRRLLISSSIAESSDVSVEVRDSGPGFPTAGGEQIFQAFYTTKPTGLGMGLSICRSIVEAHGGQLRATAAHPMGAIFTFTLPVRSNDAS